MPLDDGLVGALGQLELVLGLVQPTDVVGDGDGYGAVVDRIALQVVHRQLIRRLVVSLRLVVVALFINQEINMLLIYFNS